MNEDVKKFFGWLLMITGGLFALLTGGCGLVFIFSTFAGSGPLPIHAAPGSTSIIERLQISGFLFFTLWRTLPYRLCDLSARKRYASDRYEQSSE